MAVTVDQTSIAPLGAGPATNVVSITTNVPVAAGSLIELTVGRFSSTPASTLSITAAGGLTWTQVTVANGNVRTSKFYALAPAGLASGTTLTATNTAGSSDLLMAGFALAGVDAVTPFRTSGTGTGATTAWTTNAVAGLSTDALTGSSFGDGAATSSTPTAPAVEAFDFNSAGQSEYITCAYKLSVAGSDSIAGTLLAAATHAEVGVAYRASTGLVASRLVRSRRMTARGPRRGGAVFA